MSSPKITALLKSWAACDRAPLTLDLATSYKTLLPDPLSLRLTDASLHLGVQYWSQLNFDRENARAIRQTCCSRSCQQAAGNLHDG